MRFFLYCLFFIFLLLAVRAVSQVIKIQRAVEHSPASHPAFTRKLAQPRLKFLFVGDSTALGTGATDNTQSVAGWFGQDFPQAEIDNNSANGKRITQLAREFPPYPGRQYDLVVIQIGANDILRWTPLNNVEDNLLVLIGKAKKISKHVVILHSGNVGLAPIFIWPFDQLMTYRSRQVRNLYIRKAKEEKVLYVDLFTERNNDLFLKDVSLYYSSDRLHPSGEGYHWWYEKIRTTLGQAQVVL